MFTFRPLVERWAELDLAIMIGNAGTRFGRLGMMKEAARQEYGCTVSRLLVARKILCRCRTCLVGLWLVKANLGRATSDPSLDRC
jgi:hypothetical protein